MRNPPSFRALASHLKHGGLIAYPTESCYGLGCDPQNFRALKKLLKLKQRPQRKGLILIAANYAQVSPYVLPLNLAQQQHLQAAGANATTYLLPAKAKTSRSLRGAHDTLAVRLTAHEFAKSLCRGVRSALVSTSANRSGKRAAKTAAQCRKMFGKKVWVLDGQVGKNKQPSTIKTWADDRVVR
ncbi:MAG: L-threonylcarbamoyladenylate synthase [Gallionella sp.]